MVPLLIIVFQNLVTFCRKPPAWKSKETVKILLAALSSSRCSYTITSQGLMKLHWENRRRGKKLGEIKEVKKKPTSQEKEGA